MGNKTVFTWLDHDPKIIDAEGRVSATERSTKEIALDALMLARTAAERPAQPGATTRGEAAIAAAILVLAEAIEGLGSSK